MREVLSLSSFLARARERAIRVGYPLRVDRADSSSYVPFSRSVPSHNDSSKTLLVTAMASTHRSGFGTLSFDGLQGILNDALKIPVTV